MKFPALNSERAGVPNLSNNKNCDKFISGGLLFASLAGLAARSTRDARRCCKCTRRTKSTRHTYCWINKCNDRKKNTREKRERENYTHFYVVLCALCVFCAKSHRLKPKQINAFPSSSSSSSCFFCLPHVLRFMYFAQTTRQTTKALSARRASKGNEKKIVKSNGNRISSTMLATSVRVTKLLTLTECAHCAAATAA